MSHEYITNTIFVGLLLGTFALTQEGTKRIGFPYTIALLILGLLTQAVAHLFHLETTLTLTPDLIYYVILPVLLFGAALHINFHQFKIHFKTISFLATFGLLISFFTIALLLPLLTGLPLEVGLLFGAVISATDPIAVLAIFKSLGAPKRLALLADGESMFNDATAVILFRIVSLIVFARQEVSLNLLSHSIGTFSYTFVGSIFAGLIIGLIVSHLLAIIKNDEAVETTITVSTAFVSFVVMEHLFHLSGVITSVVAGLMVGNLGRAHISWQVQGFIKHFWDYISFVCISLVFFFAAFQLDTTIFIKEPLFWMISIPISLLARSLSVYLSALITNHTPFFSNEPNIPPSWQHVLNWGGLRGVIPLILAFTIPETYQYRDLIITFTFANLLFSLFINGLTIEFLLKQLKLHLPSTVEAILHLQHHMLAHQQALTQLKSLPAHEYPGETIKKLHVQLSESLKSYRQRIADLPPQDFERSIRQQAIFLERQTSEQLHVDSLIDERVLLEFNSQLDFIQDAVEYPEVFTHRVISKSGFIKSHLLFERKLIQLENLKRTLPFFSWIITSQIENLIAERYQLVKLRTISAYEVIMYLESLKKITSNTTIQVILARVTKEYEAHVQKNIRHIETMIADYQDIVAKTQTHHLHTLIDPSRFMPAHTDH